MTDSWQHLLGRVAGLISIAGFLPYAIAIWRGKARPNRVTWLTWSVVGGILFASYEVEAGGAARWVPLSDAAGPALIAVLSIRHGEGGFSRFDRWCLLLAGASLIGWAVSGSAMVALWLCLAIDVIGALPTIRKVFLDPKSEYALTWRVFFTGNLLNLFAIERWTLASAAYPLYVVAVSGIVNVLISAPWRVKRTASLRSASGTAR